MYEVLQSIIGTLAGAGIAVLVARRVISKGLDHLLRMNEIRLKEGFEQARLAYKTDLEVWSKEQLELFRDLIERRGKTINELARRASALRRSVLGIADVIDTGKIDLLYREYCDQFYDEPVMPKKLFDAAHGFREVVERALGARKDSRNEVPLAEEIVRNLDEAYVELLDEVRQVLLPGEPQEDKL